MTGTASTKGFAVRHGTTVAHVSTVGEAAELMRAFACQPAPELERSGLQATASCSANAMLGVLLRHFPLVGPAARNFGTALRVAAVRRQLQHRSLRGVPLLKVLGWVSAAADALRHLTPLGIAEAAEALESALGETGREDASPSSGAAPEPGAPMYDGEGTDLGVDSDPGVCSSSSTWSQQFGGLVHEQLGDPKGSDVASDLMLLKAELHTSQMISAERIASLEDDVRHLEGLVAHVCSGLDLMLSRELAQLPFPGGIQVVAMNEGDELTLPEESQAYELEDEGSNGGELTEESLLGDGGSLAGTDPPAQSGELGGCPPAPACEFMSATTWLHNGAAGGDRLGPEGDGGSLRGTDPPANFDFAGNRSEVAPVGEGTSEATIGQRTAAADDEFKAFFREVRPDITVSVIVDGLVSLIQIAAVQDELTVASHRRNLASLRKFILHFPDVEHKLLGEVRHLVIL